MQNDLVPELPRFDDSEYIVTAMVLFSRYLYAYPTTSQVAK